jgi:transposase
MMIIGCDYHPSWQQVSWLDMETGETGERKLVHASGEARQFYQQLATAVLIGMEATGNSQWFVELVEDLGHAIWIGDAAQIRASYVRKQKTDKRDAAHILKLLLEGRFPRLWTPDREQRDLRQLVLHRHKLVMIRSRVKNELQHLSMNKGMQRRRTLWSQAGQKLLRELPLKKWAAWRREDLLGLLAMLDEQIGKLDRAVEQAAAENPQSKLLMTQPGVGPNTALAFVLTIGRCRSFSAGQAGGQLPGTDSAGRKFGRKAEAGRHHQARQSHAALAAGGSGAERGALRSPVSSGVCAPLSSETQSRGQGGCGPQISRTTLLDAAHPETVSRDRSHREQLGAGPGRRKLDR